MVSELTERKNKLSSQLSDLENQPRVQAERKGQISENLRISDLYLQAQYLSLIHI